MHFEPAKRCDSFFKNKTCDKMIICTHPEVREYFVQVNVCTFHIKDRFCAILRMKRPSLTLLSLCMHWTNSTSPVCFPLPLRQSADSQKFQRDTERPPPPPPPPPHVFTCLLIVLIVPLVLLSGALMRFFPVPLGQSEGHRSNYSPLILITLISTWMKNKHAMMNS